MLHESQHAKDLPTEAELSDIERQLCELWGDPQRTAEAADFATRSLGRLLPAYRALVREK